MYRHYVVLIAGLVSSVFGAELDRGKDLYQQGKYAEAETELRNFVRENEGNGSAHRYLGLALVQQDKLQDAATHLNKASELDPGGDSKLALAHLYLKQKDLDKAEESLRDASGDDLEFVRGQVHLAKQRWSEAARDLEAALEKKPGEAYAHYYAGLAYNGMRKPDKMLSHFEAFLRMKPESPEARKVRSVVRSGR